MRPFADYPTSWGSNRASVFPHAGPTSYTVVTAVAGTVPVTGGDTVDVGAEAGMKWADLLVGGITDDGAFLVEAIPVQKSSTPPLSGQQCLTYKLRWIARVTAVVGGQAQTAGTEAVAATNLSAEVVRLLAIGPK